jgi:hypothetical protein
MEESGIVIGFGACQSTAVSIERQKKKILETLPMQTPRGNIVSRGPPRSLKAESQGRGEADGLSPKQIRQAVFVFGETCTDCLKETY